MRPEKILRSDAETELGIARFLEQYALLLAARRRSGAIGPADVYEISKLLASVNLILRLHLQKSFLLRAILNARELHGGPAESDAERRLLAALRAMRASLLPLRRAPAYRLAAASLAEMAEFHAKKRDRSLSAQPVLPLPSPWLHPSMKLR